MKKTLCILFLIGLTLISTSLFANTSNKSISQPPSTITWKIYTTEQGLGSSFISGVYAAGHTIYVATDGGGLSVSRDDGKHWTVYKTGQGLVSNRLRAVYASGQNIYS